MHVSTTSREIICKPTSWFIWRAGLMSLMFIGFGSFFYYDGAIGYKEKNADYYRYAAKSQVQNFFKQAKIEADNAVGEKTSPAKDKATWEAFASAYEVILFEKRDNFRSAKVTDTEGCLPEGFAFPQKLPQEFVDHYDTLIQDDTAVDKLWKQVAARLNVNESADEYFKSRSTIESQFKWAIGSGVLGLIAVFFLIRTLGRKMKVDGEAFTSANGKVVPFVSIVKIDKRRWKRKGLALIFYKDEAGDEQKVKVDGMVYGQFDENDPNNAEILYQQIESSVGDVEIIDYEEDDEEEEAEESPENEEKEETI